MSTDTLPSFADVRETMKNPQKKRIQISNVFNLPEPFVAAVTADEYHRGEDVDYTTTELIKPVRIHALFLRHADQIVEDASELVWRLSGQAKHVILERIAKQNPDRYVVEKRLYADIGGKRIAGQLDLYDRETKTLYDYKETSVWKFMVGDTKDWETQSNINALLCRRNGYEVVALENIAFLKDWKKRESFRKHDYPQCPVHRSKLSLWPDVKAADFIKARIGEHELAAAASDNELPLCTREERWAKPHQWAVMKRGRKTAIKLFFNEDEAGGYATQLGENHFVEERPSENTRCLMFCPCVPFCDFGREVALAANEK